MTRSPSKDWSISDVQIKCDTHWWGFVLHLNEDATQLLNDIDQFEQIIVDALGEEVEPFKDLIIFYLKARTAVIKAEDQGFGVKLVSPWIMPSLLVPLPDNQHTNDVELRWTVYDPDKGWWAAEQKLQSVNSADGPALAVFQDKLFCVATGTSDNNKVWWMAYDGQWGPYIPVHDDVTSSAPPALAVFQGKLYCAIKGISDTNLYVGVYDGDSWDHFPQIPNVSTVGGPSLAVYNGLLYCVHRGAYTEKDHVWYTTFDGNQWSADRQWPNVATGGDPAVAVYNDQLYLIARGGGSDLNLWWYTLDGQGYATIPGARSLDGPSLAVMDGKLYCAARGSYSTDQHIWWTSFDGNQWGPYMQFTGTGDDGNAQVGSIQSYATPGIVVYRQPQATKTQLLCMHRGVKT